jgi:hypothetical protein
LFPLTANAATCTWIGAVDTDWGKAGNWSACGGSTPGSGDTAVISFATNDPTVSTNETVGGLTIQSGGELTIANGASVVVNNTFTLTGGSLIGEGDLTVNGNMDWSGGTMGSSGTTTIAPSATLSIQGSGYKSLSGRTLENDGTATWSGSGSITGSGGAIVNNDGSFEAQNSESFTGSNATFNNNGTFTKSTSSGTTTMGLVFNNNGTVDVQTGTFKIDGGGTSTGGSFQGTAGSTLTFDGDYDLDANSSITHPDVHFDWGTVNVSGAYDVGGTTLTLGGTANLNSTAPMTSTAVTQSGGTLGGTGTLVVTGAYDWTGGTMGGSGTTTIASGATLTIHGTSYKSLSGRTLENDGTATWSDSGDIGGSGGAVVNNDGSFEARNSESFTGGDTTFNNNGTFIKSTSSGITDMSAIFDNNGTVDVQVGTFKLNNGGMSTGGSFQGAAGSTLTFDGDYEVDINSSITHPDVHFDWGTVNVSGAYDVGSTTLKLGGTVNLNSTAPMTSTAVTQSGGTLGGTGTLVVTGAYDWTGGTMGGSGTTTIASAATLTIHGTSHKSLSGRILENDGTATWSDSGDIGGSGGAIVNNDGSFEARNSESFSGGDTTFNNNGTFTKSTSSGTTTMGLVFYNSGTVDVQTGILKFSVADYSQTAGVTDLNGGDIDTSFHTMDIQGGDLTGEGTVFGQVHNRGSVIPGHTPGLLAVDDDYTQHLAGTLDIEIGGTTAGSGYDQLTVSGDATLAGTLNVTLDGFAPALGDTFKIVTCASCSGTFDTLNLPSLPDELIWRIVYADDSVVLRVTKHLIFLPLVVHNHP